MTDKKFEILLNDLAIANDKYKQLLEDAESEIERRFGKHPSDVDNDEWIDAYHVGRGKLTVEQVKKSMKR